MAATNKTTSWLLTLPVIDCSPKIAPCNEVRGTVDVRILWVTEQGDGQVTAAEIMAGWGEGYDRVYDWSGTGSKEERWASFSEHFGLKNLDGSPAPLLKKTIYFLPDCTWEEEPTGGDTGGENFGILASKPVLVE